MTINQLDEYKKEFIILMENTHQMLGFTKHIIAIVSALMVDGEPITQDRIIKLTNLSRSAISQLIPQINLLFSIKQKKLPKERKKRYIYGDDPKNFIFNLFIHIIDNYDTKVDFILELQSEVSQYRQKHPYFENFYNYLEFYYNSNKQLIHIFQNVRKKFLTIIETTTRELENSLTDIELSEELKKFSQLLLEIKPKPLFRPSLMKENHPELWKSYYVPLKQKFYGLFAQNIENIMNSQVQMAIGMIYLDLLIENRPLTQEELEESTQFQRSIISDSLKSLEEKNIISVLKFAGDRKKFYYSRSSWEGTSMRKFNANKIYAQNLTSELEKVKKKVLSIEFTNNASCLEEQKKRFVNFLDQMKEGYILYEKFMNQAQIEYLNLLKHEYDLKNDARV